MRTISFIVGFLMIVSCYAYRIGNMEQYFESGLHEEPAKTNALQDPRLPVSSHANAGQVLRHRVNFSGLSNAIFIIGDDPVSKKWLSEHAKALKKLHALGFITNISNPEVLNALQTKYDLPFLPANVDDLMSIIGEAHYPLILNEGVVSQ